MTALRAPITQFNGFMIGKIASYLRTKEGCNVERIEYTNDGARAIVQDSFGFRYEINIETIGRLADSPQATAPTFSEELFADIREGGNDEQPK